MKLKKSSKIAIAATLVVIVLAAGIYPMVNKNHSRDGDPDSLKIYITQNRGHDDLLLASIISDFEAKYPKIKINKVTFDSSTDTGINQYNQRLLNDTLSGEGPDILELDPSCEDVFKLEKSGVLEDLKPYMTSDKDFTREDYNSKVLDAGRINGKQLLLPVDYYVNGYITSAELLKSNHISFSNNISQNDFIKALLPYISSISSNKERTLFSYPLTIAEFIASSGINFVDYQNKKTYFDKPQFKEIVDNYKQVYNSTIKEAAIQGVLGNEGITGIKNGTTLFSSDMVSLQNPDGILSSESELKGLTGYTQIIDTLPAYGGGDKVTASAGMCMAVNSASNDKNAAYNFIKIALSEKMQSSNKNGQSVLFSIPVNKKAIAAVENNYMALKAGKTEKYDRNTNISYQKPSQNLQNYYDKISNNIGDCLVINSAVNKLMMDSFSSYFEGKESYESAIKTLENKMSLYLNE